MFIIAALFVLTACDIEEGRKNLAKNTIISKLPDDATNVKYLGEDWVYFDLDGRTFLFHSTGYAESRTESLTEVTQR